MFTNFQEAFRGVINLLGDLCTRIIRCRSWTIEIPIVSLIFWSLVLLTVVAAFSYLNASVHEVSLSIVLRTAI